MSKSDCTKSQFINIISSWIGMSSLGLLCYIDQIFSFQQQEQDPTNLYIQNLPPHYDEAVSIVYFMHLVLANVLTSVIFNT